MTGKGNKKQYVRCLLCSRQPVAVKRGHMASHLTPGGVKCHATGVQVKGAFNQPLRRTTK